jgi:hypothetical protein
MPLSAFDQALAVAGGRKCAFTSADCGRASRFTCSIHASARHPQVCTGWAGRQHLEPCGLRRLGRPARSSLGPAQEQWLNTELVAPDRSGTPADPCSVSRDSNPQTPRPHAVE